MSKTPRNLKQKNKTVKFAAAKVEKPKPDTRNKRNAAQKMADLVEIEILTHKGKSQTEIAEIISNSRPYKLSQQQISYDMAELKVLWKQNAVVDIETEKGKVKSHLELLMKEAHDAWERSQKDAVTHTEGYGPLGATSQTRTEGQTGDPRFLEIIAKLRKQYADLFGIEAPKKIQSDGVPIYVVPIGVNVEDV